MKIEQRVTMKYHYCYFAFGGLEIEDINENKILVEMSDEQWLCLAERLEAKKEYILEKRKEKLEEENAETNS